MTERPAKDDIWFPETAWKARGEGKDVPQSELYAEMRRQCPVSIRHTPDGYTVWHAFRGSDISDILMDPETFSNAQPKFGPPLRPIELDPPEHTAYRAILNKAMSPRRMVSFEEMIRKWVVEALDPLLADGGGDMAPLLYRLPLRVFCLMMDEDDESFDEIDQARRQRSPLVEQLGEEAAQSRADLMAPLREFCLKRLRERRARPRDDVASEIANALVDGKLISEEAALSMLTLLYMAGHLSTTSGLQSTMICLGRHPEVQDVLRADPRKIPAAIEESLRLQTPLHMLPRYCLRDTEIAGHQIKAGDQVFPVFAAANSDPELFPEPDNFDIDRRPNHFSFGRGIHRCAGAPLARTQIRVVVQELLARTSNFSLVEPITREVLPLTRSQTLPKVLMTLTRP